MKRIILHWSGGAYKPNAKEKRCYHYLIDGEGEVHNGDFTPEDNLNCNDGKYAAHTGGGNTGSIGIALCGMLDYSYNGKIRKLGEYPLKQIQFERAYELCAQLCKKYALDINPITVMTHYEFGKRNLQTSSAGKIDINFIPYNPTLKPDEVGDFIRDKVRWYYERL